jgi:hypothetical protein
MSKNVLSNKKPRRGMVEDRRDIGGEEGRRKRR